MSEISVSQSKKDRLTADMKRLGIDESDLVEKFVLGSGKGGQKLNKTSSCVQLRHAPSAIDLKCQQTRSRDTNRFLARRELCARIEERLLGEKSRRQQAMEKIRRQKRRRSRRQKERMLQDKHQRSATKQSRTRVNSHD
jgi:protein subunit release factor B